MLRMIVLKRKIKFYDFFDFDLTNSTKLFDISSFKLRKERICLNIFNHLNPNNTFWLLKRYDNNLAILFSKQTISLEWR